MILERLNYLHYGDALDVLACLEHCRFPSYAPKEAFIRSVFGNRQPGRFVADIVRTYDGLDAPVIDTSKFLTDARRSRCARRIYNSIGCRGFSFKLYRDISLSTPLRTDIKLRLAAVALTDLFYPPQVRRALHGVAVDGPNHLRLCKHPCIAFALGFQRDRSWYVLCLQSDIASHSPAAATRHFRGWRKLFLFHILRAARPYANTLYLCRSTEAIAAASGLPFETLMYIYDGTARDFGMHEVDLAQPVNVQVSRNRPPVSSTRFYRYDLRKDPLLVASCGT